jgi:hypothetical protein
MSNWRRVAWFFVWFPLWYPIWKGEELLRKLSGHRLRRGLKGAFPDVRTGDIFVIRLHAPSPWGTWAHSAIAIDGWIFCHSFARRISAHHIEALPVRYAIAQLRVRCSEAVASAAADKAKGHIGKRASIYAVRGEQHRFSCASLIADAYSECGVQLVEPSLRRIVPDDLYLSEQVNQVRLVFTEQIKAAPGKIVVHVREPDKA